MTSRSEIDGEKAALRMMLKERRAAVAKAPAEPDRPHAMFRLAEIYPDHLRPPPGSIIAAYMPIGSEMDPDILIRSLDRFSLDEGRGYGFALPRTPAKDSGMPLTFHEQSPLETPLERSAFGVLEPPTDWPEVEPDLLLVPLLGFDRLGYRLGYGAGHYDRTLAALRARRPVLAVGLAWACQEVDRIPTDAFDQALDWVVTEKEAIGPLR